MVKVAGSSVWCDRRFPNRGRVRFFEMQVHVVVAFIAAYFLMRHSILCSSWTEARSSLERNLIVKDSGWLYRTGGFLFAGAAGTGQRGMVSMLSRVIQKEDPAGTELVLT